MARFGRAYPIKRVYRQPQQGQVVYDATGAGAANATGTLSWSHTINPYATGITLVCSTFTDTSTRTVTASVGATSMTLLGSVLNYDTNFGFSSVYLFGLLNPPSGIQTVTASITGATTRQCAGNSTSYTGVSRFGSITTTSGASNPSMSVSSGRRQMISQAFGGFNASMSGYNQTSRYNVAFASGNNIALIMGDARGASSVSFSATTSTPWGGIGVPLVS